ncbi:MAG TPA: hypothetical protein VE196_14380, partial [Pseudonocardiaceae bacterium]|nr:hypothetical protein [Pseudonocardiaceae bacterium]
ARRYFSECESCAGLAGIESMRATAAGGVVCQECARSCYWRCDGCEELIDSGDYCESCESEYDHYGDSDAGGLIRDYGYKPEPDFHGGGPLFLGMELEINTPWSRVECCAEIACEYLGDLGYLKEDCSIDRGFEIVTHPMSYAWAMQRFPWAMLTRLAREGCSGEDTGLHVHISREAFHGPAHVYRWMKLLYRNTDQVITVARRRSRWAAFTDTARRNIKNYAKGAWSERYQAINTQNAHTFELRIFASSLHAQQVQAALGLAAASVEYTRALSVPDIAAGGWDWLVFTAWLGEHPEYSPLCQEMEDLACAC